MYLKTDAVSCGRLDGQKFNELPYDALWILFWEVMPAIQSLAVIIYELRMLAAVSPEVQCLLFAIEPLDDSLCSPQDFCGTLYSNAVATRLDIMDCDVNAIDGIGSSIVFTRGLCVERV